MKIAYITTYDAKDVHAWSGTGNAILTCLENAGHQVRCIGNLETRCSFTARVKSKLLGRRYMVNRVPSVLASYARQAEAELYSSDCDIVFSPGTIPIAHLRTTKPVVYWTDATFPAMVDYYTEFSGLAGESIRDGTNGERLAMKNCSLAIYSSHWAAETARSHFPEYRDKVHVVPFGGNQGTERTALEVARIASCKQFQKCKLLFAGVDWIRKGGNFAVAVGEEMNRRGFPTELHVLGCSPGQLPAFARTYGFISKASPAGAEIIDGLFSQCHFLVLPSKAECAAMVLAEASSYGLPSVATDTGGNSTLISDGINGRAFHVGAKVNDWCDYLCALMRDPPSYVALAKSAHLLYSTKLNWRIAGASVTEHINKYVLSQTAERDVAMRHSG